MGQIWIVQAQLKLQHLIGRNHLQYVGVFHSCHSGLTALRDKLDRERLNDEIEWQGAKSYEFIYF